MFPCFFKKHLFTDTDTLPENEHIFLKIDGTSSDDSFPLKMVFSQGLPLLIFRECRQR